MYKYRRVVIAVIALLLVVTLLAGLVAMLVRAETPDDLRQEGGALAEQSEKLPTERAEPEAQIARNNK